MTTGQKQIKVNHIFAGCNFISEIPLAVVINCNRVICQWFVAVNQLLSIERKIFSEPFLLLICLTFVFTETPKQKLKFETQSLTAR